MPQNNPLYSKTEITDGLSGFFSWIVFMGGYWQTIYAISPIFAGFVLSLGAPPSAPSNFISLLYMMAFVQLFSHVITNRIENKKKFIIKIGSLEPLLLCSLAILPFIFKPETVLLLIPFIIMISAGFYQLVNPLLNAWYGSLVPDSIRASYIGKRTMFSQLTAVICLFIAGKILDTFKGMTGFSIVFVAGAILGFLAFSSLKKIRYPVDEAKKPIKFSDILSIPVNNSEFALFSLFYGIWSIGWIIVVPNISVLMINYLELSYSRIALYQNSQLLMMLAGYSVWPRYIHKYGAIPVIKVCLLPVSFVPFLWLLVEGGNHSLLIPVSMLYGFGASGVIVGANTHLVTLLPRDNRGPAYMVFWSAIMFLSMAVGPQIGAFILRFTDGVMLNTGFFTVINTKLALLSVGAFFLAAYLVLRYIRISSPIPSIVLIDQIFRRNPFSLAYNLFLLDSSGDTEERASAIEKLGRKGGAMALDSLLYALGDINPVVRRKAASIIGHTGIPEAVSSLARIMNDPESDIRDAAAYSLGMFDTPESRTAILAALKDPDPSVRASSIRAYGGFKGKDADGKLIELLKRENEPLPFSAIAESLSKRGNTESLPEILNKRSEFRSPKIRDRIIYSAARLIGAEEVFYEIISRGTKREFALRKYLNTLIRDFKKKDKRRDKIFQNLLDPVHEAFENGDYKRYLEDSGSVAEFVLNSIDCNSRIRAVSEALILFVDSKKTEGVISFSEKLFCAVCLGIIKDEVL